MRQKIELVTLKDVSDFTEAVSQIDEEVTLIGKDENGKDWSISGKSFLASLVLANGVERAFFFVVFFVVCFFFFFVA